MNYSEMTPQQRARHLISCGVTAKIAVDSYLSIGYAAFAMDAKLPCGCFETKEEAITAGEAWLADKAK